MRADRLASLLAHGVAFDVETHKVQPGLLVPPLVCASVARWDAERGRPVGRLLDKDQALEVFVALLDDERVIFVVANGAYDFAVMAHHAAQRGIDLMPKIFAAYEADRVFDVQIAEALHAIARGHLGLDPRDGKPLRDPITKKRGRYSLAICLHLVLGRADAKANDQYRNSYALLDGVPVAEWPEIARVYPVDDSCNTLETALAQAGLVPRPAPHLWPERGAQVCRACGTALKIAEINAPCPRARPIANMNLHDLARQCRAALAMHLGAAWGFSVDADAVDALAGKVRDARAAALPKMLALGFLRMVKKKGVERPSKNTAAIKRATALAYGCAGACVTCAGGGKVPSAKTGKPSSCRACDATGLDLDSAPVPRTKGSKCRTCRGTRRVDLAKKGREPNVVDCAQCAGQPDVIPGCQTSRDALSESGAEDLIDFASYLEDAKITDVYLPFLRRGIAEVPDEDEHDTDDEGDDE